MLPPSALQHQVKITVNTQNNCKEWNRAPGLIEDHIKHLGRTRVFVSRKMVTDILIEMLHLKSVCLACQPASQPTENFTLLPSSTRLINWTVAAPYRDQFIQSFAVISFKTYSLRCGLIKLDIFCKSHFVPVFFFFCSCKITIWARQTCPSRLESLQSRDKRFITPFKPIICVKLRHFSGTDH